MRPNEDEGSVICNRLGERGREGHQVPLPSEAHQPPHEAHRRERGEDRSEENTWEQAIDEISTKLLALKEKYGAKTLSSSEGTYRSDHLWARTRFFDLLGNPGNVVDPGTICWCWNYVAQHGHGRLARRGHHARLRPTRPARSGQLGQALV